MHSVSKNIFEVLESPPSNDTATLTPPLASNATTRRSHVPLTSAGHGLNTCSVISPPSTGVQRKRRRRDGVIQDLGFVNPGPKNLVSVANVLAKRLKPRRVSAQEKPSSNKPLYDPSGLVLSDGADRCDCNLLSCPGCFVPCASCQSSKCGLDCRNSRTYAYEYRLYGTNKEITQ